jgi:hypothetical protein
MFFYKKKTLHLPNKKYIIDQKLAHWGKNVKKWDTKTIVYKIEETFYSDSHWYNLTAEPLFFRGSNYNICI